jgi:arabinogalactan oligomer/maltooligosaccharide transport system permease protein
MKEKSLRQKLFIAALVVPAFVVLFGVVVYPFFYNLVISLSNMSLRHIRDWKLIGLGQYVKVFTEPSQPNFYTVFVKTVIWTAVNIFFHVVIGVFLALVLNQKEIRGKALFRAVLVLPWAVPQLIVALTWRGMFNYEYGAINLILTQWFGLPGVQWLKQPFEAFCAVIITNVWLGFPFMMVIAL